MADARGRTSDDLWRAYSYVPLRLAQSSECGEAIVRPGGLIAMSGVPDPDWNWAFVYGRDDPARVLSTFVEHLRRRALPGYVVSPAERADDLAPTARRLGLSPVAGIPLMLNEAISPAPRRQPAAELTVEPVSDVCTLLAAQDVIVAAFQDTHGYARSVYRPVLLDLPGVHLFTVQAAGILASYCATIEEGDVVWFMDVGTHPDHRHKGAATSLLLGAMDWWRERGRRTFGLGAEPGAQDLYTSLGFQVVAESRIWLVEAAGSGA